MDDEWQMRGRRDLQRRSGHEHQVGLADVRHRRIDHLDRQLLPKQHDVGLEHAAAHVTARHVAGKDKVNRQFPDGHDPIATDAGQFPQMAVQL